MKPYEDIPNSNGMKCLFEVVSIESKNTSNVVLRNITEDFWHKVIEAAETFHVCAMGTPGVGKTSTTCILIRILLEQQKTVVYRVRDPDKNGIVYMFTPTSDPLEKASVNALSESEFIYNDSEINKLEIYYIVDPGRTVDNCNLNELFSGNVIIVASPDERHWGGSDFMKSRNDKAGIKLFFPVWTLQELMLSSAYITKKPESMLTEAIIKERFYRFGGVPRFIFATSSRYSVEVDEQQVALTDLSTNAALSLAYKDRSAINSQSSDLPKGILLSYIIAPNDCGTYRTGFAVFTSDYIYDFIVKKFMASLWKQMITDESNFDPYLYEAYVRKLFYDRAKKPKPKTYKIIDAVSKVIAKKTNSTHIDLGGCVGLRQVCNITESAVETPMVVFYPYSPTYELIDFIYRVDGNSVVYNCFQCTIKKDHDARSDQINDLVNHIMNTNSKNGTMPQINIFYAVPQQRFASFVTNPPMASKMAREECMNRTGNKTFLYLNWDKLITVKILCVDPPGDPDSQPSAEYNEEDFGMPE